VPRCAIMVVMEPVNVDGVRRIINVSPEEMSDDKIRLALVRLEVAAEEALSAQEHEEHIRRFAAALERAQVIRGTADDWSE
jgi:hypothetical protein